MPFDATMTQLGNMGASEILFGDNLSLMTRLPTESVSLIYIDPPFNTGRVQARTRLKTTRDPDGDRTGFQGARYRTERGGTTSFVDMFDDYLAFLAPRLKEGYRLLSPTGSFYFHIDYREVHYVKVLLDSIFGRDSFLNEIIWAYDYGGRSKRRWPAKHDNILLYVKDPARYTFNTDAVDRIPYMAPGLVGPEKAARGKLPTDVWWQTIVPPGRQGEHRLRHPEAAGAPEADRGGVLQSWRNGDGLLCRKWDNRSGGVSAGQAVSSHGRQ